MAERQEQASLLWSEGEIPKRSQIHDRIFFLLTYHSTAYSTTGEPPAVILSACNMYPKRDTNSVASDTDRSDNRNSS